jgi:nicotinate-nucleotide pyrophosphorylase (carboxylating)
VLRSHGWQGILAGTRKTTPGFRVAEKYAILVGGGDPNRHDLSSMIMLKDNHVWARANQLGASTADHASGTTTGTATTSDSIISSIPAAVSAARAVGGFSTKIEVEVRSVEEAHAAIGAGADVVMLDNFTADGVQAAATRLKEEWASRGKPRGSFLIEVSGGLTEHNAAAYACDDVDLLSTSAIHQGVPIIDFSLKVAIR